jgi:enamine deaminase RidA (YjgF/YER057c/UK114 family)
MRKRLSSGSSFEELMSYSRAVIDDDWVHVSGTTGFDYATMTVADDVAEQTEQCFRNIRATLEQAGATLGDVVRVHYILPIREDFQKCWPVIRKYLGDVRPAATMFTAGLADVRMKIEIEVTARKRAGAD